MISLVSMKWAFFMPGNSDKKDFNWEAGETLDDKAIDPVGEVRAQGLPKIKTAVHADPTKRKQERDQVILNKQSAPYQKRTTKKDDGTIIIEETHSGLVEGLEDSKAKKLIDSGKKFRGFDRFSSKKEKDES